MSDTIESLQEDKLRLFLDNISWESTCDRLTAELAAMTERLANLAKAAEEVKAENKRLKDSFIVCDECTDERIASLAEAVKEK